MSKYVIDSATLTSIGDAVREKEGSTGGILVQDIPARILAIETGGGGGGAELPPEAYVVTGDCSYRFAYDGWNWYIDSLGKKVTTKDIENCQRMFYNSANLEEIPFDLNFSPTHGELSMSYIFYGCKKLKRIPKFSAVWPDSMDRMFYDCYSLVEITEEDVENIDLKHLDSSTSSSAGARSNTFVNCYSLRRFPMSFFNGGNSNGGNTYSLYYNGFSRCYVLDEIVGLPIPYTKRTWTSNAFSSSFDFCSRLKRMTFATQTDGSPIVLTNWKSQTIDLTQYVGYAYNLATFSNSVDFQLEGNEVKDDASYQALKNSADWWTSNEKYSRYNHDSAVETISSLPDVSGSGGTNTIKFKGAAGAKTDGGAINTLTAEEIAVATAKGWTVTLV